MKRILLLFAIMVSYSFSQTTNENVPDIKLSGFIKTDFFLIQDRLQHLEKDIFTLSIK